MAQQDGALGVDADLPERVQAGGASVEEDGHAPRPALELAEVPQVADVSVHGFGDGLGGHAEGGDAIGVDRHRDLAPRPATRRRLADAGDRGEPGRHPLFHEVVQRVAVLAPGAEHVDHHREAREQRGVERRHHDPGPARLRALQGGRDALQLELAHLEVGAGLEAHLVAPDSRDLAQLSHTRQGGDPPLQSRGSRARRLRLRCRAARSDEEAGRRPARNSSTGMRCHATAPIMTMPGRTSPPDRPPNGQAHRG